MDLSLYKVIRIPKKGGFRMIHAPCDELKEKQRQFLANEVRAKWRWPRGITAFLPRRSIVDAARPHVGKRYLVHLDIKDFFHHVTKAHVVKAMAFDKMTMRELETRAMPLAGMDWRRINPPVGLLDIAFIPSPKVPGEQCLPQGGPLSPHLSLLASKAIYFKTLRMFRRRGIDVSVTMYADGIFISSNDKRVMPMGTRGVQAILRSERFEANPSKTRITTQAFRQKVCGLVVNRKLAIPKKKRREIRARVHNLYMDKVSGKEIDKEELLYLEGFLAFATSVDKTWAERHKKKILLIRAGKPAGEVDPGPVK